MTNEKKKINNKSNTPKSILDAVCVPAPIVHTDFLNMELSYLSKDK